MGESIADNYLLLGTPVTRGGHLKIHVRESSPFSFFLPPNLRIFDPGSAISAGALTLLQLLAKLYGIGDARTEKEAEELLKREHKDGRLDHATYVAVLAKLYGV